MGGVGSLLVACALVTSACVTVSGQQPVTPPSAPAPIIYPSLSLPAAAADVFASLLSDALTAGPTPGQPAPRDPLTRARCAAAVAALFPGRSVMVKQGLKDPCAILAREAVGRVADKAVVAAGTPDPAALASGAPADGGGLRTPTPPPSQTSRANVTGGPRPAGNGTAGLIWVRRNETRGGDVVLGGR